MNRSALIRFTVALAGAMALSFVAGQLSVRHGKASAMTPAAAVIVGTAVPVAAAAVTLFAGLVRSIHSVSPSFRYIARYITNRYNARYIF